MIRDHKLPDFAVQNFIAQFENDRALLERYYSHAIPAFEYSIQNGMIATAIYGVGRTPSASFFHDYEKLASGNFALTLSSSGYPIYDIGDMITLTNENGENRTFEIIGVLEEYPFSLSLRMDSIPGQTIVIAENQFVDFFQPNGAMQVNFNVTDEMIAETELWIAEYTTRDNPSLAYISRDTLKAEFDSMRMTYLTLGSAMAFILALIGVLNFVNTITASIIVRRRELAMLQSVGMTGKQLRYMLFYEGAFYAGLTVLFTLTIGIGIGRLIVNVIAGQTWFFRENLTIMPSIICTLPLLVICAAMPLVCYKWMMRDSLVKRLRIE